MVVGSRSRKIEKDWHSGQVPTRASELRNFDRVFLSFFGLATTEATQIDLGAPTSAEQLDNATMQENLAYI